MAVDNQLQHDILTTKTSDNPLFTSHSNAVLNKALNTKDKRIVGAINELKKDQASLNATVNKSLSDFLTVIGDFANEKPELLDGLLEIGPNILEVIILLNNTIEELKEEIKVLKEQTPECDGSGSDLRFISHQLEYNEENIYELPHLMIPEHTDFEMTVNGIEQDACSDFTVDHENGILYWDEETAVYSLTSEDRLIVQYYINSESIERIKDIEPVKK